MLISYLHKKLLYKAAHRGSKELDVLLSNFVSYFFGYSDIEKDSLKSLEMFLEEEDPSLLDYFLGRQELPSYVSKCFKDVFLQYRTHFILEKKQQFSYNLFCKILGSSPRMTFLKRKDF